MRLHRLFLLSLPAALMLSAATTPALAQTTAPAEKIDTSKTGVYTSGLWEYRFTITAPDTKSQGTDGKLLFGDRLVEPAIAGDYYQTPWGPIQYVGEPALLWQPRGWMPRAANDAGGRALAEPWLQSAAPVVMAMVLTSAAPSPTDPPAKIDDLVGKEMQKLNVKTYSVERNWFPLNDQAVTLHDSKMFGSLLVRLAPARQADTLTVLLDGTHASRTDLPRKDAATQLVHVTLGGPMGQATFYIALRVDRAAPNYPKPLDVGPESDGKEVAVKGTREVIIALPCDDKSDGFVWSIKSIQGDDPLGRASVQAVGKPQFNPSKTPTTPATTAPIPPVGGYRLPGTYENTLRITSTGKSTVELEYKRSWQTDAAPEKTFRVTLDVQDVPNVPVNTSTKP